MSFFHWPDVFLPLVAENTPAYRFVSVAESAAVSVAESVAGQLLRLRSGARLRVPSRLEYGLAVRSRCASRCGFTCLIMFLASTYDSCSLALNRVGTSEVEQYVDLAIVLGSMLSYHSKFDVSC